jgi:hypothetical protein
MLILTSLEGKNGRDSLLVPRQLQLVHREKFFFNFFHYFYLFTYLFSYIGGITTLIDMPLNSFPSTVSEETLKLKVATLVFN